MSLTHDDVRAAGGIVHSDGNIFFTNIDKLNATAAPLLERIKELERHNKALVERRQHDVADINDGVKKLVDLEQQLEAARKDAERLGWMIFHSAKVCHSNDAEYCYVVWNDDHEEHRTKLFGSARAAIDAAISKEQA